MVCPVMQGRNFAPRLTDIPFEELYRPWSWSLSSCVNILLFALLLFVGWKMVKRSRARKADTRLVPLSVKDNGNERKTKSSKVLVIGGLSISGSAVISKLAEEGMSVIYCLDLFIPANKWMLSSVSRYIQCDPKNKEDMLIALQEVDTVYVMPCLTLPNETDYSPEHYVPVGKESVLNVVDCCTTIGTVSHLVLVSSLMDTARVLGDGHKVTEMSCPGGSTQAEKSALAANSEDLKTCVVRSAIAFAPLGDEDIDIEPDELCNNRNPDRSFPLVSGGKLGDVVTGAVKRLTEGHNGAIYLAYEKTADGREYGELCLPHLESKRRSQLIVVKQKDLVEFDVDDSETRRVLRL